MGKVVLGGTTLNTDPGVVSLLTEGAMDMRLRSYLRCLAMHQEGFTAEQGVYLEQLWGYLTTNPTAEEYQSYVEKNPFPASPNRRDIGSGAPPPTQVTSPETRGLAVATLPLPTGAVLRAVVTRFNLSSDGRRVTANLLVENRGSESLSLALAHNAESGVFSGPMIALSDDLAGNWYPGRASGIHVVPCCYRSTSDINATVFSTIAPGANRAMTLTFTADNDGLGTSRPYNTPGARPQRPREFSMSLGGFFLSSGRIEVLQLELISIAP
jgi:hypothetical protein